MPVEPPATTRSSRTRATLIRAVHDEVARSCGVDVAAISRAAGVSPATFYAHFDTHDDALAAALEISLDAATAPAIRLFRVETMLEDGLDEVVDSIVRETVEAFRVEAMVMRAALARLPHHKGIRDVYRRHEGASREHLTRQIRLGQRAGLFRDGDPGERATSVLVLTEGLNNPLLHGPPRAATVLEDIRRAIATVLRPTAE